MDLLSPEYHGLPVHDLTDEVILSQLEGTAEELSLPNYESLKPLSADCIVKMYKVIMIVCGHVGSALALRYEEITGLDEYQGK